MNKNHIQNLGEDELLRGLKPLLSHAHWAYFEEFIRREQLKQVRVLTTSADLVTLHQAQGNFARLQHLTDLKSKLNNLR